MNAFNSRGNLLKFRKQNTPEKVAWFPYLWTILQNYKSSLLRIPSELKSLSFQTSSVQIGSIASLRATWILLFWLMWPATVDSIWTLLVLNEKGYHFLVQYCRKNRKRERYQKSASDCRKTCFKEEPYGCATRLFKPYDCCQNRVRTKFFSASFYCFTESFIKESIHPQA